MRLDLFLAQRFPEHSRAILQKLIAAGRVEIGGAVATDAAREVAETDEIKVHFPHQQTFAKEISDFAPNVIYEDENVVVVNKPAGILTHMKGGIQDEFTVADFVKSRILAGKNLPSDDAEFFAKTNRPGIVHRLDRATSGVLIAAKNPEAAKFLARQFQERKARKTYFAIVETAPKIAAARIDLPIGRNPKRPSEFRVDAKGKSAITDYETVEIFADNSALVELKPLTGRTHQLRVHLAHIGAPIVGDTLYNPRDAKLFAKNPERKIRLFLHAAKLEITIPHAPENERKTFTADLPDDFRGEIKRRKAAA